MRATRTRFSVAGTVERAPGVTRAVVVVVVETVEEVVAATARPTRATLRGATLLGCCDLCADVGITTPATSEGRLPGGAWAALCDAHGYRARTAKCLVIDAADAERSAA